MFDYGHRLLFAETARDRKKSTLALPVSVFLLYVASLEVIPNGTFGSVILFRQTIPKLVNNTLVLL